MIEVTKNIYMTEFPLSGNPLKEINIFVVKTDDKNMIVDTGFNTEEDREALNNLIKELDLDLKKTILYLTHLHSDHVGLAKYLENLGIDEIYLSRVDGKIVETGTTKEGIQWSLYVKNAHKQGLDIDELKIEDHPGYRNRPRERFHYTPVDEGDRIEVGDFKFEAVNLSGHTPGMMGLYEKDKKILFCGDHILGKITPNITFWGDEYGDSLGIYLKNLEKIKDMDIKYLLSSHRYLIEDVNERIEELKAHHKKRLDETRQILKKYGEATTREVTKNLNWDIRAKNWDEFPKSQKWFASGEAHAHIVHLISNGEVEERIDEDGVGHYKLK